ncbi:fimbrial biogenesis outer membrane usher protein [Burkholderia sp. JSH-S8]|nr:fimbrial biogenesis outer membrane usher protein [Burkholderia sp. JSH-S8]
MTDNGCRRPLLRPHPLAWAALVASSCWTGDLFAQLPGCVGLEQNAQPAGGCRAPGDTTRVGGQTGAAAGTAPSVRPDHRVSDSESEEVQFNPAFFSGDVADLSRFSRGNPVSPGRYALDLSVNGKSRGRYDVVFQAVPGSDVAVPCFTLTDLDRMGVDTERAIKRFAGADDAAPPAPTTCIPLSQTVPGALTSFNTAELKLDLIIPQVDMRREAAGYVDPSRWDHGIDAGIVQYSLSTYAASPHAGSDFGSAYLGLQSGINVGGWRIRQRSTANWQNRAAGTRWQSVALFAQHDVTAVKSQVTLGDSSTSGDIFDSFNVRGVQLSSDDRMLPDSMRAFAPVVRGVADTNARVTVRQNGVILVETSVPPGPFELDDLPATGHGGDLDVTVMESDGRERTFRVPFAAVPQLLRPGISRFNVTTGAYRDAVIDANPWVAQVVYQRGLTNLVTGYAGGQASEGYWAGLLGVALNTPAGAFAFDVTVAKADLPTGGGAGFSGRVSYSKLVPGVGTNLSIAAYRYSTAHFYNLRDAIYALHGGADQNTWYDYRTRDRVQLNINQPLGGSSALYLSGSSQNYWGSARGYDLQYQVGFNSSFKRVSYSLYAQRTRLQDAGISTQIGLNLTIPLGHSGSNRQRAFDYLTANLSRGSNGDSTLQTAASGNTAGVTPVNYGVNASRIVDGDSRALSVGGYAMYRAPFGTFNGTASVGNQTSQAALNASGSVIAHGGGVTFGPPLGQAFALVEADGAKGGAIINGQGARIDGNGYAIVPSLHPYRVNRVGLDPSAVPLDVELSNTSEEVVPRANSLVLVRIATQRGRPTFAETEDAHGRPLPLGTELVDASGRSVGMVGQGGMAYLRGVEGDGRLLAQWGAAPDANCVMPYAIPPASQDVDGHQTVVAQVRLTCDPSLVWAPPEQSGARDTEHSN